MLGFARTLLFEVDKATCSCICVEKTFNLPPPPRDDIFMAALIFQFDIQYSKKISGKYSFHL
jgi:hypothetical protein